MNVHTKQVLVTKSISGTTKSISGTPDPAELITKAAERVEEIASTVKAVEKTGTEFDSRLSVLEQLAVASPPASQGGGHSFSADIAHKLFDHERFTALREGAKESGKITIKDTGLAMLRKATLVSGAGGSDGVPTFADGDRAHIHGIANRQLALLAAIQSIPVTSNRYEFVQRVGVEGGAAPQSEEGAKKAETTYRFDKVSVPVSVIAHWVRGSVDLLDDFEGLSLTLRTQLVLEVLQKLESELVDGDGTGGGILGLVPQASAFASVASNPADRIGEAIAELASAGWAPGLVVMHPRTWQAIRSERAVVGDGQYLSGGWATPAAPSVWNIPVITTPSMMEGEALVFDPSQVAILDRMSPTLLVERCDEDNLTRNLVTLLAELRAGLAVLSPAALLLVSLAEDSSSSSAP